MPALAAPPGTREATVSVDPNDGADRIVWRVLITVYEPETEEEEHSFRAAGEGEFPAS